jgi:hypothetical protein
MMRRFKTYALLIEFDPEKPFCLHVRSLQWTH